MAPLLITVVIFVGVTAVVFGAAMLFRGDSSSKLENRLDLLTGATSLAATKEGLLQHRSLLAQPLDAGPHLIEAFLERFGSLTNLFEQADVSMTATRLLAISGGLGAMGFALALYLGIPPLIFPAAVAGMGCLPLVWLLMRRKRRLKAMAAQVPAAMEMLARALRAGQSLAAGFGLIGTEIGAPLGKEFGRVFEEQNLGIPVEESLKSMADRIPNLDVRFFATAVILQRQTGGDLAEILDRIGELVRDRYRIWGQIQALTGEGRLSGIVLMGLPVVLFLAMYYLNHDYVMVLFTDPTGKQLLAWGVFLQVLGALVIRWIVNIKV
jgi:tight adherence protein B